jgi:hypothetical protein
MGDEVIIVPLIFFVIFGIFYLFVSSRHKERMALIEKGVDASIFYSKKAKNTNLLALIIMNFSILLMSIGVSIFLAPLMHSILNVREGVAYPGTIFTISGVGLFLGYKLTMKMSRKEL